MIINSNCSRQSFILLHYKGLFNLNMWNDSFLFWSNFLVYLIFQRFLLLLLYYNLFFVLKAFMVQSKGSAWKWKSFDANLWKSLGFLKSRFILYCTNYINRIKLCYDIIISDSSWLMTVIEPGFVCKSSRLSNTFFAGVVKWIGWFLSEPIVPNWGFLLETGSKHQFRAKKVVNYGHTTVGCYKILYWRLVAMCSVITWPQGRAIHRKFKTRL